MMRLTRLSLRTPYIPSYLVHSKHHMRKLPIVVNHWFRPFASGEISSNAVAIACESVPVWGNVGLDCVPFFPIFAKGLKQFDVIQSRKKIKRRRAMV
jgi:hypothetical protein